MLRTKVISDCSTRRPISPPYFERDEVLRCGGEVHAARNSGDGSTEQATADSLSQAASMIASSTTAFTAKGGALPELTAMYFAGEPGIAEVMLVSGRTVIATHPPPTSIGSLLGRHLRGETGPVLLGRHRRDGGRLYLAFSGAARLQRRRHIVECGR